MRLFRTMRRAGRALALLAAVFALAGRGTGFAEGAAASPETYDAPEVRPAADVVPPALLRAPHHRLDPNVVTFAFMNQYSVPSDYGPLPRPAMHGCAGWSAKSPRLPHCKKSIRATRSQRRPSTPGKA
jgi:hypothetical protein